MSCITCCSPSLVLSCRKGTCTSSISDWFAQIWPDSWNDDCEKEELRDMDECKERDENKPEARCQNMEAKIEEQTIDINRIEPTDPDDNARLSNKSCKEDIDQTFSRLSWKMDEPTDSPLLHHKRHKKTASPLQALMQDLKKTSLTYGQRHHLVSERLMSIGDHYVELKEFSEAIKFYKQAIEIYENELGIHCSQAINGHIKLAKAYFRDKNITKSLEEFQLSLDMKINIFGENHTEVAELYEEISIVHSENGDNQKAAVEMKKALRAYSVSLGSASIKVVEVIESIGALYRCMGLKIEAEAIMAKVVELKTLRLGERHPGVANSLLLWGICLEGTGDDTRAMEVIMKAHQMFLTISFDEGKEHPSVSVSLTHIGDLHSTKGDDVKAMKSYEEAIASMEEQLSFDKSEMADLLMKIGNIGTKLKEWQKAEKSVNDAKNIYQNTLGKNHKVTNEAMELLAKIFLHQKKNKKALEMYEEILQSRQSNLDEDAKIGEILCTIGQLHLKMNSLPLAFNAYISALVCIDRAHGRNEKFADTMMVAAGILEDMGKYAHAEKLMKEALDVYKLLSSW